MTKTDIGMLVLYNSLLRYIFCFCYSSKNDLKIDQKVSGFELFYLIVLAYFLPLNITIPFLKYYYHESRSRIGYLPLSTNIPNKMIVPRKQISRYMYFS